MEESGAQLNASIAAMMNVLLSIASGVHEMKDDCHQLILGNASKKATISTLQNQASMLKDGLRGANEKVVHSQNSNFPGQPQIKRQHQDDHSEELTQTLETPDSTTAHMDG